MYIRKDVLVARNKKSKNKPWVTRWWGKFDPMTERQRRYSKSFVKKKQAERFAQSLKDDVDDGISVEILDISLGALCDKCVKVFKMTVAPTSMMIYSVTIARLKNYFGSHRNIKTIRRQDAESFIADIELLNRDNEPSDSTRDRELRNAKLIFNKALLWEYIRKNPFKGIKLVKAKKDKWHFITPEEFKAMLNVLDNQKVRRKLENQDTDRKILLKAFYSVMYGGGLRFGEAVSLRWDTGDIDFVNSQINLTNRKPVDGLPPFYLKDHEARSVPAPKWVMELLKDVKATSSSKNPYVFLTDERLGFVKAKWEELKAEGKEYKWLNSMMVLNTNPRFRQYCGWAGINTSDRLSVHCLRKAYGTNLANLGTPVHTLKELMGHSSIQTTMEYYVLSSDANKRKAAEALEKLVGFTTV